MCNIMLLRFGSRRETPTKLTWSPWIYNELDVICNEQLHPIHCDFSLLQMSVCNHSISRLLHYFFLLFGMKLGNHNGTKLTSPDFSGKFVFWVFGAKRVQKWPKIGSLSFFSRLLHYFFLILDTHEVKVS